MRMGRYVVRGDKYIHESQLSRYRVMVAVRTLFTMLTIIMLVVLYMVAYIMV